MLFARHYLDPNFEPELLKVLEQKLAPNPQPLKPVWICIGSDRHILDCLGPMTGTMLLEYCSTLEVYGTLAKPIDAKNFTIKMEEIKKQAAGTFFLAIDASVGDEKQIGMIKLKDGPLLPGQALAQKLPPVGDVSITGIVGGQLNRKNINQGSISLIYAMAKKMSMAIWKWHQLRT